MHIKHMQEELNQNKHNHEIKKKCQKDLNTTSYWNSPQNKSEKEILKNDRIEQILKHTKHQLLFQSDNTIMMTSP